MTIHQCPKCELRFAWKTEVDDHCWHDHPEFRHEYPAGALPPQAADPDSSAQHAARAPDEAERRRLSDGLVRWLVPRHRDERTHAAHPRDEPGPVQQDNE